MNKQIKKLLIDKIQLGEKNDSLKINELYELIFWSDFNTEDSKEAAEALDQLYEILDKVENKKIYGDLERAAVRYCDMTKQDGFVLGFRTALSLLFGVED